MRLLLFLLALTYIIIGVLLFILTDATKEICRGILKQKKLKALSILPLTVGIILILGSSVVNAPWVVILLGVLGLLKGLLFIFGPEKKTKAIIDWWLNASNAVLKSWGVVAFLVGILLLLIL